MSIVPDNIFAGTPPDLPAPGGVRFMRLTIRPHPLVCCLLALGFAAVPAFAGAAAAPQPATQLAEDCAADGYDVFLQLAQPGPSQRLLMDWRDGAGLILTLDASGVRLGEFAGGKTRSLGTGRGASPGLVHVRRRFPAVTVTQDGEVLLRTWSRRPLSGQVAPASDAGFADFRMQPVGELDFSYDFADMEGTGDTWQTLAGDWRLGVYRDALFQRDHGDLGPFGASWYQVRDPHRAISVTGADFWSDYRARASVQAGEGLRSGLVFCCQDADNYALFAVRPAGAAGQGIAELSSVRRGVEQVLATAPAAWRAGVWYELAVDARDQRATCRLSGAEVFDAALPAFDSGRVGVFADGAGLARADDVRVQSLHDTRDDFTRDQRLGPRELGEGWAPRGGDWKLVEGGLAASGASRAFCTRVGPRWPDATVSARVAVTTGSAGVCLLAGDTSGYTLGVGGGKWTLTRLLDASATELLSAAVAAAAPVDISLSDEGGLLRVSVGGEQRAAADVALAPTVPGLFVAGRACFQRFSAGTVEPSAPTLAAVSGTPEFVPVEPEGQPLPVLGYVWRPRGGQWEAVSPPGEAPDAGDPGLRPSGSPDAPSELWYYQPCPGDARLQTERCSVPAGATVGLAVSCTDLGRVSGYTLELTGAAPARLSLRRLGQIVAQTQGDATGPCDLSLWRCGPVLVARAGSLRLAFQDPQPLAGDRCGAFAGGPAVLGRLRLAHGRARLYPFREVETDWQPAAGDWLMHSGMACIAWDYWLTGRGQPRAVCTNIRPQPADLHVDFWVSEYTEGFADGEHHHYPYHDVSLATGARPGEFDSGYRFLIAGEGGTVTRLLRLGKVVAETTDPRFAVRMGGHCNQPRSIHVIADQVGGRLRLSLNDALALDYQDPEPLAGGHVLLGVEGCAANFRDLWLAPIAVGGAAGS